MPSGVCCAARQHAKVRVRACITGAAHACTWKMPGMGRLLYTTCDQTDRPDRGRGRGRGKGRGRRREGRKGREGGRGRGR
eukprot:3735500-Rhodomonas_salina.2